jgi:peptidoglycan-associated lipoprotein
MQQHSSLFKKELFMRFKIVSTTVLAALLLLGAVGCKPKAPPPIQPPVQTPAPTPAPTPPPPAPVVVPQPPPAPVDSFKAEDLDAEMKAVFVPIYFSFDKYDLSHDAIGNLEKIASFLKDKATVKVLIEGNADERGSSEYNMALGDNRARAVKKYLVGYGISADRLETTSYGKEHPAVPNCSDEDCHSKNRRDEWKRLGN